MTSAEQFQAWRAEWGDLHDGTDYETWLERRLWDMQDIRIKSLQCEAGRMDAVLTSELVSIWTQCMADMMNLHAAENVLEFTVYHPEKGPLTLTLQRKLGKSPMDLLKDVVVERDESRDIVAGCRSVIPKSYFSDRPLAERVERLVSDWKRRAMKLIVINDRDGNMRVLEDTPVNRQQVVAYARIAGVLDSDGVELPTGRACGNHCNLIDTEQLDVLSVNPFW